MSEKMRAQLDLPVWVETHFSVNSFNDTRLSRRLKKVAGAMAAAPEDSIPDQNPTWVDTKAAYRFLSHENVTPERIQESHRQQVREICASYDETLCIQDGSELDYSGHRATRDLGILGNGYGRGLLQHSALAVTPDGKLVGVLHQEWWRRQPTPQGETRRQRQSRSTEAGLWETAIETIGHVGERTRMIHVMDRGSDSFQTMDAARRTGVGFLLRAKHDRCVTEDDQLLWSFLPRQSIAGYRDIEIASQPGKGAAPRRPARTARLAIRYAPVTLMPPKNDPRFSKRPPIAAWAVYVQEVDPPASVTDPVEWMLLTSERTDDLKNANKRVDWYGHRWIIEELHKVEKTGCGLELARLRTGEALESLAAIIAVIAVRMLQLRDEVHTLSDEDSLVTAAKRADESPTASSKRLRQCVPADWILAVAHLAKRKPEQLTFERFWLTVALQGGFIGRKSDGWPGWQRLWRGWLKISDLVRGMGMYKEIYG